MILFEDSNDICQEFDAVKGILHETNFYHLKLIFWMGLRRGMSNFVKKVYKPSKSRQQQQQ